MPTYTYTCDTCKNTFDHFQTMTSDPLKDCKCGALLRRLIGPGGAVIFKGTGFYQTDYKNKK